MTDEKRRCLVFLYASIIRPTKSYRNVYDYQQGQYHFYRMTRRNGDNIMVFDYTRRSYMGGNLPNIYDYKESYHELRRLTTVLVFFSYCACIL